METQAFCFDLALEVHKGFLSVRGLWLGLVGLLALVESSTGCVGCLAHCQPAAHATNRKVMK